jgi:hypothetical protein
MFEGTNILVRVAGGSPAQRWSQAAQAGNAVAFALSDTTAVDTFDWRLLGRPEGSVAGGSGPEPISLGTAQTCSVTADIAGTYIIGCILNGGSPSETLKTAGVAVLETITDPSGRPLRLLGPMESDQDSSNPAIRAGWVKMLNRWLRLLSGGISGGTDQHDVRASSSDTAPGFLDTKLAAGDNIALESTTVAGVRVVRISSGLPPGMQVRTVAFDHNTVGGTVSASAWAAMPGAEVTLNPVTFSTISVRATIVGKATSAGAVVSAKATVNDEDHEMLRASTTVSDADGTFCLAINGAFRLGTWNQPMSIKTLVMVSVGTIEITPQTDTTHVSTLVVEDFGEAP